MTPEQAELAQRQQERWNDPATHSAAEARGAKIGPGLAKRAPLLNRMDKQLRRAKQPQHKIYWLRQIAQTWSEAVAPHAACRDGCSACCYQPVMITEGEAQVMAKEIGVPAQTPTAWRGDAEASFIGAACPFLVGERCSIYNARPIACRTLYNMDADALLCTIVPGATSMVPHADSSPITMRYVGSQLPADSKRVEDMHMADIRDFFPPQ